MRGTSLSDPRFMSLYSRRSYKLWFSLLSSVLESFQVTKRLANSSVRTVMEIRIIASRFSTIGNLPRKGLPSGIQKIVAVKCSRCRESVVCLQRRSAVKCVLLSPGRSRVISIGFIQIITEV